MPNSVFQTDLKRPSQAAIGLSREASPIRSTSVSATEGGGDLLSVNGCKRKQQNRTVSMTGVVDALVRDRDGFKNQKLRHVSAL